MEAGCPFVIRIWRPKAGAWSLVDHGEYKKRTYREGIMFENMRIGFVGGGNMGEALIKGFLRSSLLKAEQVGVFDVDADRVRLLQDRYGVRGFEQLVDLAGESQVILLAVKPQTLQDVLTQLRGHLTGLPLVISIAAGISLAQIEDGLPEGVPVIRVMPNTPALVMEGAAALSRGAAATEEQMQMALRLFQTAGKAIEVEEKWMDAVTGLSGSGPGYVLYFLEALIDAGVLVGLPRATSRELVLQTVKGTVSMVMETGKHPAELKDWITSPAGTTICGLQVLEERAVRGAVMRAVQAATLRSQELGKK